VRNITTFRMYTIVNCTRCVAECRRKSCRGCPVYCSVVCRWLPVSSLYYCQRLYIDHCRRQSTTSNTGIPTNTLFDRSYRTSTTSRRWIRWIMTKSATTLMHKKLGDTSSYESGAMLSLMCVQLLKSQRIAVLQVLGKAGREQYNCWNVKDYCRRERSIGRSNVTN